jgi:superfamily II DNA or RNA helicase
MAARTSKLCLILPEFTFEDAAKLTWGLSGIDLSRTEIKIEIFLGSITSGIEPPADNGVRTRIGWLRYLLENNRLHVHILPDGVSQVATAVWWDNANQPVAVSLKHQNSADDAVTHFEAYLDWSFGNPDLGLVKQLRALERVRNGENSATNLEKTLKLVPSIPPPFEEIFDEEVTVSELVPGYELRQYQEKAIQNWILNNHRGIFAMCTGSGKTIAAFGSVMTLCRTLIECKKDLPFIVVTVPKIILADQWVSEIEAIFDQSALKAYGNATQWQPSIRAYTNSKQRDFPRFIVTTYRTLVSKNFREAMARAQKNDGREGMLIADESHNISSSSIRETLNELAELLPYRLALSATPLIEKDEAASRFILSYFNENIDSLETEEEESEQFCGTYTLANGIRDKVLCRYDYYPLPMFLDPNTGSEYLRILREIDQDSGNISLYSQRREIIQKSNLPLEALKHLLEEKRRNAEKLNHTLVYCQPGNTRVKPEETDEDESSTQSSVINLLQQALKIINECGLETKVIIGGTSERDRTKFLREFRSGEVDCLCAIGCLDEGVDIPSIKRAIVLYSIDRERQFVQRRGRILRQDRGNPEKRAEIYDVILLPHHSLLSDQQALQLLAKEMRRYREFAVLADNRFEAETVINTALAATSS